MFRLVVGFLKPVPQEPSPLGTILNGNHYRWMGTSPRKTTFPFWTCLREALAQSRVRFNTVPEKVPEKQPEAASGQVIPKIPGEGLGGFGAKPSQARQTGESSEEVLVQSQVKFNGFRRRPGRLWCAARSGSTGFQRRFRKRSNLTCCTKASWNLLRSLVRDLLRNPLGNLRNCLRNLVEPDPPLHQSTPELFWAEDPISLRCWGIKNWPNETNMQEKMDAEKTWKNKNTLDILVD